jgi:hypothetical protein
MLPSCSGRARIPKCGRSGEIDSRVGTGILARRDPISTWHDALVRAMRLSSRKLPGHETGTVQTISEEFEAIAGAHVVPVLYFFCGSSGGSLKIIGQLTTAIVAPQITNDDFDKFRLIISRNSTRLMAGPSPYGLWGGFLSANLRRV